MAVRVNVWVNDEIENISACEVQAILQEAGIRAEKVQVRKISEREYGKAVDPYYTSPSEIKSFI